jgi:hypothetical protein
MQDTDETTGWEFVAERESMAPLIDTLLALDSEATYTKTEIAEHADVPLKTLYLNDVLEECADLGVLQRVDAPESGESVYRVADDSDILDAAAAFDDAYQSSRT